ncbi:Deoxymugineic acid synthase 1 [Citrus sinensis]|uniref:Deoxymugineic acid synthase 1 n=1 Tax=Citrus sinensis TaxID=2711 RepID=A0ACB8N8V8_CITSI|nr:Deoxymugineic acid synthase 1 [Citrus sinensis]
MVSIPEAPLGSTGKTIPLVGFGTAQFPHFDTAAIYQSEEPLGEAIAQALRLGLIKSRDELFITSKLWFGHAHRQLVLPALQTSLKNLGLEHIDLYLIHFPVSLKPGTGFPFSKEDIEPLDYEGVWEAMEECQNLGLTKSIGVSNFACKKLERLLATAKIPPAVNQVELNPVWQQKKLRDFCEKKGIHITAYSPLGAKGTIWGTNRVMECQMLKEIANAKGKSVAQVSLRWVYQQGVSLVVKSFNKERMKENLDIFYWELSAEELQKIEQIPQYRGSRSEEHVSEDGPYKSLEDLWDGEI